MRGGSAALVLSSLPCPAGEDSTRFVPRCRVCALAARVGFASVGTPRRGRRPARGHTSGWQTEKRSPRKRGRPYTPPDVGRSEPKVCAFRACVRVRAAAGSRRRRAPAAGRSRRRPAPRSSCRAWRPRTWARAASSRATGEGGRSSSRAGRAPTARRPPPAPWRGAAGGPRRQRALPGRSSSGTSAGAGGPLPAAPWRGAAGGAEEAEGPSGPQQQRH